VGQLKHALRQLKLRSSLSSVVILMLALGIGATTAIFSGGLRVAIPDRRQRPGDVLLPPYARGSGSAARDDPARRRRFDPKVPVTNLKTLVTTVQESVYIDRLLSMLSAGFAALATVLAGIGRRISRRRRPSGTSDSWRSAPTTKNEKSFKPTVGEELRIFYFLFRKLHDIIEVTSRQLLAHHFNVARRVPRAVGAARDRPNRDDVLREAQGDFRSALAASRQQLRIVVEP
jgi:hypothetical protein